MLLVHLNHLHTPIKGSKQADRLLPTACSTVLAGIRRISV
jgi:hypothetical protein